MSDISHQHQPKPYPEYKNSGHAWLGNVPAHWAMTRAKLLYKEIDERSTTGLETLCSVSHKTGVTPRKASVTMFMSESTVGYKICRPDDLAINTLWAWMAALGIARQVGVVSPAYGVYRPRPNSPLTPEYADRLLRTEQYKQEYIARSTGVNASRLRLYPEQFLQIPILVPPPDEQSAIVRFLEAVDRRVNRLVRAKRRLIELLTEQKQAIITHAVTRGLNPNAKLKPSPAYWLPKVPEKWEVRKLRFLAVTVGGLTPSKPNEAFWNGTVPWVSPKDMKFVEIVDSIDHITAAALEETSISLIPSPAVLIVVRGMILARTFPVGVTTVPVTINQDMKALIPRPGMNATYLRHLLSGLGDVVMSLIEESGHGTQRRELCSDYKFSKLTRQLHL